MFGVDKGRMLPKLRAIFVDFDDTLCLHSEGIDYSDPEALFADRVEASHIWYKNSIPNKPLLYYLRDRQKDGVKVMLLTASGSLQLEAKISWLEQFENIIELDNAYAVSVDCAKKQLISAYMKAQGLSYHNCLLIDDDEETRTAVEDERVCIAVGPEEFADYPEPKKCVVAAPAKVVIPNYIMNMDYDCLEAQILTELSQDKKEGHI